MDTADADKLMKKANKHCDPSFFSMRIKADWEQAQPMYERAAKMYKVHTYVPRSQRNPSHTRLDTNLTVVQAAKCYDKARYAFERAATGQERQSSPWQAGKLLEQAASCAKETGDLTQVAELSRYSNSRTHKLKNPLQRKQSKSDTSLSLITLAFMAMQPCVPICTRRSSHL